MIIDGHNYCFPQMDSPQGYDTLAEKMRMLQSEYGGHYQPPWRVRDHKQVDNSVLVDPETGELRDIRWTRHNGNIAWEYQGEIYAKQHTPPMLHNLECTPELMLAEMDYAGIDMGVLHTYPTMGHPTHLNAYLRDATTRFPDRFRRMVYLREASIPNDSDAAIKALDRELAAGGVAGYQFIPGYYYNPSGGVEVGHDEPWDDGPMRPFWDALAERNVPVYFTLIGGTAGGTYQASWTDAYIEQQRIMVRWMERYPHLTTVITHGFPWMPFMEGEKIVFPEAIWEPFQSRNCYMQIVIVIQVGRQWEYPWKETESALQECVDRIGADRLIWGTDMPMVARFCTYTQCLDQFRKHCDFLTDEQRADILGGTAARLMGIEEL